MGMNGQTPEMADVIGLPTYIVDTVIRRDAGGFASIINCRTSGSLLIPQCEIVISAAHLITIGEGARSFALEMCRQRQMAQMLEVISARH